MQQLPGRMLSLRYVELHGNRVESTVSPHSGENFGNEDERQDEDSERFYFLRKLNVISLGKERKLSCINLI